MQILTDISISLVDGLQAPDRALVVLADRAELAYPDDRVDPLEDGFKNALSMAFNHNPDGAVGFVLPQHADLFWTEAEAFWHHTTTKKEVFNFRNGPWGESLIAWNTPNGMAFAFLDPECGSSVMDDFLDALMQKHPLVMGQDFWCETFCHWPGHMEEAIDDDLQELEWPVEAKDAWKTLFQQRTYLTL